MEDKKNEEKLKTFNSAAEEIAAIDLAIKKAQLEDIELQKQERQFHMQDLKQRLDDRGIKEQQKKDDREAQGRTFATQRMTDENRQRVCTHKKGGVVSPRDFKVLNTGGNGQQYAVIKHQMINGDLWVRCLRCAKTWVPPMKDKFYFNERGQQAPSAGPQAGKYDADKFKQACVEYMQATNFETNNSPSGSVQCKFSRYNEETGEWVDASAEYRKQVLNTNLR